MAGELGKVETRARMRSSSSNLPGSSPVENLHPHAPSSAPPASHPPFHPSSSSSVHPTQEWRKRTARMGKLLGMRKYGNRW
eukprot:749883-Hanusia_phi.AAC.5